MVPPSLAWIFRKEIALPTRDAETGIVPIQMALDMVNPQVRAELKAPVIREILDVTMHDIYNLQAFDDRHPLLGSEVAAGLFVGPRQ